MRVMKLLDHLSGRLDLEFRKRGWRNHESFGLNSLDHKINEYIYFRNGVFIEAGGNDGYEQSNSLFFEKYLGWTGLLIEPIPHNAELCRKHRPTAKVEQCALVPFDYPKSTIDINYCNLMSVVDGSFSTEAGLNRHLNAGKPFLEPGEEIRKITVPARNLSSVIDKAGLSRIDMLSLDVEGFEVQVLRGLDFDRHAPRWMVVEGMDPGLILDHVGDRYGHVAALTEGDQLYRLRGK